MANWQIYMLKIVHDRPRSCWNLNVSLVIASEIFHFGNKMSFPWICTCWITGHIIMIKMFHNTAGWLLVIILLWQKLIRIYFPSVTFQSTGLFASAFVLKSAWYISQSVYSMPICRLSLGSVLEIWI